MVRSETSKESGRVFAEGSCCVPDNHEIDFVLCATLEAFADSLPGLPPVGELRRLTERLQLASSRWRHSTLRRNCSSEDCPRNYRLLDAIHAEDVIEAIWDYWRDPRACDAERLAYMLRALFDGCRRAVVIERLTLGCSTCQFAAKD